VVSSAPPKVIGMFCQMRVEVSTRPFVAVAQTLIL